MKRIAIALVCSALVVLLAACATPAPPAPPAATLPERYTEAPLPGFDSAAEPLARWWTVFGSAPLEALVSEALAASPTLAAAGERLRAAERLADAEARDARLPRAELGISAARQRNDPAVMGIRGMPGSVFPLYGVGVDVRYDLDLAGRRGHLADAAGARAVEARAQAEAARAMLAGNVAAAALQAAALEARLDVQARERALLRERAAIAEREAAIGARSQASLRAETGAVDEAEARAAPLRRDLAAQRARLAVLLGRAPAQGLPALPRWAELAAPAAPLAVGWPAAVVARRPDVRLAEARVREAAAHAGAAAAALYPQLTLAAGASSQRQRLADLADGLNLWNIGLKLAQPLLDAPALRARRDAAQAGHAAALADHRDTVAQALGEVAEALHAVHEGEARGAALRSVAGHARARAAIAAERERVGGVSRRDRLDAEREALQAEAAAIEAVAAHRLAVAALLQAVGGPPP